MDRKIEIIENSYHLMHLHGYHGTSVKKITDAAGIPKGSFYNYFENKEDYAKHVIEYLKAKDEIFWMFDDEKMSAYEKIRTFFKNQIDYFKKKEFKYGCFVGNLTQEMADVSPMLSKVAEDFHNFVAKKIEKTLSQGKKAGDLSFSLEEKILADFLINAWQGTLLRMKSRQKANILDEYLEVLEAILK